MSIISITKKKKKEKKLSAATACLSSVDTLKLISSTTQFRVTDVDQLEYTRGRPRRKRARFNAFS